MLVVTVEPVDVAADDDDVDDGDIDEADDGDAMNGMLLLLLMTVVGRSGDRLVVTTEPIVGDCKFIEFGFCWAGAPLNCCCMTALNLF